MFTLEELRRIQGQMAYALDGLEDSEDHQDDWRTLRKTEALIAVLEAEQATREARAQLEAL